jgi:predicted dienelactone hydrolase
MSQIDRFFELSFLAESTLIECPETNWTENINEATDRNDGGDFDFDFDFTESPTLEERFQAVVKHRLEMQIESHPPLFPWETELVDYPDYADTPSLLFFRSKRCAAQLRKSVNLPTLLPESVFRRFLASYQTLAVKLVKAVESFFSEETEKLKDLPGLILRSPYWSTSFGKHSLLLLFSMMLPILGMSNPVKTAERMYLFYSTGELLIPVKDLDEFAKTGVIEEDWRFFQRYLPPKQLQKLQRILVSPIEVHRVAVSDFLYSPEGELVLQRLSKAIATKSRQPKGGIAPLRTALILASKEPSGLTLLNVLRKYPTGSIQIDLVRALGIATELEKLVNETNRALAVVAQKSEMEAATIRQPLNFSQLPDIRHQGKLRVQKQTLKLHDLVRNRYLLTDVYLPYEKNQLPVIVISHGLGTDSSNFSYLATHLASYGFAVIVPNHSGSSQKQLLTSVNGVISKVVQPDEFYNRPLDVKYILDELSKSNKSKFQSRLNLQKVGVFGQSLGGYTALALAGAQLNFGQIEKNCNSETLKKTWNMSLLLQCRLLLSRDPKLDKKYNLEDPRVKAVIAVNPITSTIFGKAGLSQIKVPVMIVASSDDTVAPALYEQILPFSWISNTQKYLIVLSGGTHFSAIGNGKGSSEVESPSELIGDNPKLARSYMNILTTPFFQTYVVGKAKSALYLNAAYAKAISSPSMGLSLIKYLKTTDLP